MFRDSRLTDHVEHYYSRTEKSSDIIAPQAHLLSNKQTEKNNT